jgi:CheY-like chemotaxis protein
VPGVLIIEDHQDSADLLREIIEMMFAGLQVEVAYSGATGIERAGHLCPTIVLCDLDLPDMDGYAVARSLRANVALSGARLVAYSGYSQERDRTRSREAGFDLHLTKPVEPEILARLLADTGHGLVAGR